MATIDVSLLYTIIEHHQACDSVKWALRKHSTLPCKQRKYLIRCLDLCLKNNYFWYEGKYYHQNTGVAMGAKFAPSVTNIFMAKWEEESIYRKPPKELSLYKRYIDDIIILWCGEKDTLSQYLEELNQNDRNIHLSWNISEEEVTYLDLVIRQENNKFWTKTHFKSVDRNSYLPIGSCHHINWLSNIPKGQLI